METVGKEERYSESGRRIMGRHEEERERWEEKRRSGEREMGVHGEGTKDWC